MPTELTRSGERMVPDVADQTREEPGEQSRTERVQLRHEWGGLGGVFGGHVFSVLTDTAARPSDHRIASLALCFTASAETGDATIELVPLHTGRQSASQRFALIQNGRMRAHGVSEHATFGQDLVHAPSQRPPERSAVHHASTGHDALPCRQRLENLYQTPPALEGLTGAWVRFPETPADVGVMTPEGVLATLLDAMPPGLFARRPEPWFVPTLSFSAHFGPNRDFDPAGWMYVTHTTTWSTDTHCADECTVWDEEGRLLAQGRQTRSIRWST